MRGRTKVAENNSNLMIFEANCCLDDTAHPSSRVGMPPFADAGGSEAIYPGNFWLSFND